MTSLIHQSSIFEITDWITSEKISKFVDYFGSNSLSFLDKNDFLRKVALIWIKNELVNDILIENPHIQAIPDHKFSHEDILKAWIKYHCDHKLESLYLSRKHLLDRVTCSLIRVKNNHLAFEIYHRLKEKEYSFEYLSWTYAEGIEKRNGGKFINSRMQSLPPALPPLLLKMKPGEVLKPHTLGDWFAVLILDKFDPAQFDSDTKDILLDDELNSWFKLSVDRLVADL